jgi:hypothetical protein
MNPILTIELLKNQIKQDLGNIENESWEEFGRLLQGDRFEQAQLALF